MGDRVNGTAMLESPEIAALAKQARDGLAADEQLARAYAVEAIAAHGPGPRTPGRWSAYLEGGDDGWAFEDAIGGPGAIIGPKGMTDHIVRHDPVRILADVAARRILLDEALRWRHWAICEARLSGDRCNCRRNEMVRAVLTGLAAPYRETEASGPSGIKETRGEHKEH
jgi:hypothetical protein